MYPPRALNACYCAQRASAALIVSEATKVSMQGQGYAWTPGIQSREQVEGWRLSIRPPLPVTQRTMGSDRDDYFFVPTPISRKRLTASLGP